MKLNTLLLISLLLSVAMAATLEVEQKHIFTEEDFNVEYTTTGPTTQHKLEMTFVDQVQTIYIPNLGNSELFESKVKFTAPPLAGEYEVDSDEGRINVNIEEPMFMLTDIIVEPSIMQPRETAKLSYTIENVGDTTLYNIKGKMNILLGAKSDYEFDSSLEELFVTMGPGEKRTVVKEIAARESAEGQERLGVEVGYEFDGERHYARGDTLLSVGGMPWIEILIIIILVILVGRVVLARYI